MIDLSLTLRIVLLVYEPIQTLDWDEIGLLMVEIILLREELIIREISFVSIEFTLCMSERFRCIGHWMSFS